MTILNIMFDENGTEFSKGVENTWGKGEIARYEQFLLFPQCFQKTCAADMLKQGLVWERVNPVTQYFDSGLCREWQGLLTKAHHVLCELNLVVNKYLVCNPGDTFSNKCSWKLV